jgi:hypothetical protein
MKHSILALTFSLALSFVVSAQENKAPFSTKSQFSIALLHGLGHTRYQQAFGELSNLDRLNGTHVLMFKYRYRFSEKMYAEAGWGFGAHVENMRPPQYDLSGLSFWYYHPFMHARVELAGSYELFQHQKSALNAKLGVGYNRFAAMGLMSSSSSGNGTASEMTIIARDKRLPFISIGLEYVIPTKRKDEFSFYLGYQHAFRSFYDASYNMSENFMTTSAGSLSSNLRALQLAISYTFTRFKKNEQLLRSIEGSENNIKTAKKKMRFERRAIDPQSQYVFLGLGMGVNAIRFNPNNNPFRSPNFSSLATRVSYEHGWKNNIFFEADYAGFSFWEGARMNYTPEMSGAWGGDAFYGHFLSAGVQYKIQNPKTNFQFFNIHGGIGLGAHFRTRGTDGWGGGNGTISSSNYNYSYNYISSSDVKGNLMPILYGGISKDIRITERFLLNLTYRHQLGLNNVYATKYIFSDSNNPVPKELYSRIDGTAFFLQMGFKYRIK